MSEPENPHYDAPAAQPDFAELLDQGNTYRCGAFSVAEWFATKVNWPDIQGTASFQRAIAAADRQHGLSFGQVRGLVDDLSYDFGLAIRWFGDGYSRSLDEHRQLVIDDWCVVTLVNEDKVVDPASGKRAPYYHFFAPDEYYPAPNQWSAEEGVFHVADPFYKYSGEDGVVAESNMNDAINANGDPWVVCLAWRFD